MHQGNKFTNIKMWVQKKKSSFFALIFLRSNSSREIAQQLKNIPVFYSLTLLSLVLDTKLIKSTFSVGLILLTLFLQINVLSDFIRFLLCPSPGWLWMCLEWESVVSNKAAGILEYKILGSDPHGLSFGMAAVISATSLSQASSYYIQLFARGSKPHGQAIIDEWFLF